MSPAGLLSAVVVLGLALSPTAARAAACCGAGHGFGQWLLPSERAAATIGLRAAERFGAFMSDRDFVVAAEGNYDREIGAELGWLTRPTRRMQLGVTVPVVATWKRLGGAASSGGGPGDVQAAARVDVLESGVPAWAPAVALTFAATLPTGRSARTSRDPLGADVTGLGAAELRPGLWVEKSWDGFQASFSASAGFRTAYTTRAGDEVELAPRLQLVAAAGPTWTSGVSLTFGALYEREAGARFGGRRSDDDTRERASLLAALAYDISARWTAIGSVQLDVPITGFGRNEVAAVIPTATVRYVWGAND